MAVIKALSSPGDRVPLALGAITAAWAVLSWLTMVPSADKLAEAIQVQRLLDHHAMVWSFPGQTHGGVLEYPIQLVLAWLSPGSIYLIDVPGSSSRRRPAMRSRCSPYACSPACTRLSCSQPPLPAPHG